MARLHRKLRRCWHQRLVRLRISDRKSWFPALLIKCARTILQLSRHAEAKTYVGGANGLQESKPVIGRQAPGRAASVRFRLSKRSFATP